MAVVVALLLQALGVSARAVAEEVTALLAPAPASVLTTPRDPADFLADMIAVMPRPVILFTRQDAVAHELLLHTRTLSELDALRTSQALCDEAEALDWDPLLFVAIIYVESYFDHLAVSYAGAEGLMQLLPPTAEWMAERLRLAWPDGHTFDPVLNVRLGAHYLAYLHQQFHGLDATLTAYNRGPSATRYLLRKYGRLPASVEEFYAAKVLARYHELQARYGHLPLS